MPNLAITKLELWKLKLEPFDLIVIGGGPAGLMAAGRAGERGKRVLLLERGPSLGRKLLTTGNGRCNVTNSAPLEEFIAAFGRQGNFLRHAFTVFGNTQLLDWLHGRGVETIEERLGRVFPATQEARSVLEVLAKYAASGNVTILFERRAEKILTNEQAVTGIIAGGEEFRAGKALIATGGASYPATGSTGDGYELARQAGHAVIPVFPALVAFETKEEWVRKLQGIPIKNVNIVASGIKRKLSETFGEALWTHYGISGPAIFELSRDIALSVQKFERVKFELDFRPTDQEEAIDKRLLNAIKRSGNQQIKTILAEMIPARVADVLLQVNGIEPKKLMNQVSKSDRGKIVRLLKRLELHVTRARPLEEAIVTGGGVALNEVEAKTMESTLVRGLYFAGEVLDIDGPTGGFNLQAAFSTGYLVGEVA
jgi:predicted Rossmann fold flavoprotein